MLDNYLGYVVSKRHTIAFAFIHCVPSWGPVLAFSKPVLLQIPSLLKATPQRENVTMRDLPFRQPYLS